MSASLKFVDSSLKLERAKDLIKELKISFERDIKLYPPRTSVEDTGDHSISFRVSYNLPRENSTILGDIIHNLRSSLDLMATQIVRHKQGNTKDVYFPFSRSETDFNKMITRKNFHRAGEEAVELLKTFRPYKDGNILLRAIHDIDVKDKHVVLQAIPVSPTVPHGFKVGGTRDKIQIDVNRLAETISTPNYMFPEKTPLRGQGLFKTLEDMVSLIVSILEAFAAIVVEPLPDQ